MNDKPREIEFTYPRKLRLRRPVFKMFNSVRYLDVEKLRRGSHVVELGKFEDCGCDCTVRARVRNGRITGIVHSKCKKAAPMPPELEAAFRKAREELAGGARPEWRDVSIDDLVAGGAVAKRVTTTIVDGECSMMCVSDGKTEICTICCTLPPRPSCMVSEPTPVLAF